MADLQLDDWPPAPVDTERLVVRAPQVSDREGLLGLLTSPQARRFLGGPIARADAEAAVQGPYGRTPGSFVVALAATDILVGTITLDRRDADRPGHLTPRGRELEVSYVLDPACWGRGYAFESVTAVLWWASGVLPDDPDDPVIACTQSANSASHSLLHRLGFGRVGPDFVEFGAQQTLWSRSLSLDR